MNSSALWTFQDAVEYLIDSSRATGSMSDERRNARRAVLDAYREFPLRDDWSYFTRRGQFITESSQSTGTITYDHTGGAYERLVTLSGATWPDNARYGAVIIGSEHYLIESRISSTAVTLRHDSNPGADVAAGTGYTYYRNVYPVPLDFRAGTNPMEFDQSGRGIPYVTPSELLTLLAVNDSPQSWANAYTIRGVTDDYNTLAFELTPPPSTAVTFTYLYQADPRPLQTFGASTEYSTGTLSVSGTTVTGVGTSWAARMEGCVIRFPPSGSSTIPTGIYGAYGNDNPAHEYRVVMDVATITSLTIDQSLTGTYSGAKYTIGDPLDLDYHVMLDAFLALCDLKLARLLGQDRQVVTSKEAAWQREFAKARGQDARTPSPQRMALPRYAQFYSGEAM